MLAVVKIKMEAWLELCDLDKEDMGRRWVARMSAREADWLEEGGQKDDWTRAMTALSLTACESGSDVKNKLGNTRKSR